MLELLITLFYISYLAYLIYYASQREKASKEATYNSSPSKPAFFDRHLFLHAALAVLGGIMVLVVSKHGYGIHVPYLAAVLSGVGLGWLEPRKGWIIAIIQVVILLIGYFIMQDQFVRQDLAAFSVFGSMGLILVGGLLGGVLKRNLG